MSLTKDPELLKVVEGMPKEAVVKAQFKVRYLRGSAMNAYDHDCFVTKEGVYLIPSKNDEGFEEPKFIDINSIAECKKKVFFGPNLNIFLVDGSKIWLQCSKRSDLINAINMMK